MKNFKILLSVLMLFAGLQASSAQKKTISENNLPVQSQEFIATYFKGTKILQVEAETILGIVKAYNVVLDNGMVVEFTKKGDWTEVKGKGKEIPAAIVPQKIRTYVSKEFSKTFIKNIEKKGKGYSVEISNGLELEFSLSGDFKRIDN